MTKTRDCPACKRVEVVLESFRTTGVDGNPSLRCDPVLWDDIKKALEGKKEDDSPKDEAQPPLDTTYTMSGMPPFETETEYAESQEDGKGTNPVNLVIAEDRLKDLWWEHATEVMEVNGKEWVEIEAWKKAIEEIKDLRELVRSRLPSGSTHRGT